METSTETVTQKPKRVISAEHKSRMLAGRKRAAEKRREKRDVAALAKTVGDFAKPLVRPERALPEFAGLNNEDCPIDCTVEKCCITGAPICGHPKKCGLQAAYKADPEIMARYNRARKMLAHAELDRRP